MSEHSTVDGPSPEGLPHIVYTSRDEIPVATDEEVDALLKGRRVWLPANQSVFSPGAMGDQRSKAKVWCFHSRKKPMELLAVVLEPSGALVSVGNPKYVLAELDHLVGIRCPTCTTRLGRWDLSPERLAERIASGTGLEKIHIQTVAARHLRL